MQSDLFLAALSTHIYWSFEHLGCRPLFISLQATPLDPHLLLSGFFSSSVSFVLMSPRWSLKIAALCCSQLQNAVSFRALSTVWNGLTCLLVKGLSSSLDCRLDDDRVPVWVDEHCTQSLSRINGSEWWMESEGQPSGQQPSSMPPSITHSPDVWGLCCLKLVTPHLATAEQEQVLPHTW